MPTAMTDADRLAFLGGTRVAVVGIERASAGPLLSPVWYEYDPDNGFRFLTSGDSAKFRLLGRAGRASICIQEDGEHYGYVAAEGRVSLRPVDDREARAILLSMALRYLGPADGPRFIEDFDEPNVHVVTIEPDRWQSEDLHEIRA